MDTFQVDVALCRKDGICAQVCPMRIISAAPGAVPVIDEKMLGRCIACGQCMAFCPTQACIAPGLDTGDMQCLRPDLCPTPEQVEELLFARRSTRNFREKPVPREILMRIVDAIRFAPTARNMQNLRWIVLESREETLALVKLVIDWLVVLPEKDPETAAAIQASGFVRAWERGLDIITRGAPQVAIVVGPKDQLLVEYDAAIALTYFEILAQSHGIGCCWGGYLSYAFAHPAATAIREHLDVAEDEALYSAQMIGYPKFRAVSRPPRKSARVVWK